MGAIDLSTITSRLRLKREDCKRTKHDSAFSEWKILIGPSDWEDYLLGKEGVERYRIQNLPLKCSCPGLYELGVAASLGSNLGRDVRKLDPGRIVVVYLGQADNVRARLQHYGRAGSHLDHGNSNGYFDVIQGSYAQGGPGLFKDIFSRGFPIVFRWAAMENKKEAEKTEAQLLRVFDYAWNKGGNGVRRPNDILLKLDKISSSTTAFPYVARKLQEWLLDKPFIQRSSGIRIKPSSPPSTDTQSSDYTEVLESDRLRSRIFKFGRSRPRLVFDNCGVNEEVSNTICGVALGDGSVCRMTPVEGRKRCGEHKGKRIHGFRSRPVTEGKPAICRGGLEDGSVCSKVTLRGRNKCEIHEEWTMLDTSHEISDKESLTEGNASFCGVVSRDGSVCKNKPTEGRKRCVEHKGQRVQGQGSILRSVTEGNMLTCGVDLGDGSVCMEIPVHGRKRCEMHKGKRITSKVLNRNPIPWTQEV